MITQDGTKLALIDHVRATVGARNRVLRDDDVATSLITMAQLRLQLQWIAARQRPWRGAVACLALCQDAGWCLVDGNDAGLTERGVAVLAALDASGVTPTPSPPPQGEREFARRSL